jgi:hypothetical protein
LVNALAILDSAALTMAPMPATSAADGIRSL